MTSAVIALAPCSLLAWTGAEAQSLNKLDVNVFPAGFILPLSVAPDKGFFARNGPQLVPPFTLAALDRRFNELTTALALLGHFQGGVAAARRAWAAEHRGELIGFIRGNIAALDWLYDTANKGEALQIFQAHLPGT